jgi:hypothetical protein
MMAVDDKLGVTRRRNMILMCEFFKFLVMMPC